MALVDTYNLIYGDNGALLARVTAAVYGAALAIRAEDAQTPNHDNRLAWANTVLETPETLRAAGTSAFWHVCSNASIRANPAGASDSDIEFSVIADALPRLITPAS